MLSKQPLRQAPALLVFCVIVLFSAYPASGQQAHLPAYTTSSPATDAGGHGLTAAQAKKSSKLTTFMYTVRSSRDGNSYSGSMVGQDPFGAEFTTTVINTPVVPVILTTNAVADKITVTGKSFSVNTKPGVTVFDPTVADDSCLASPNDVPITLMLQSPIFQSETFVFGPTDVGTTQYVDAFQRGNFWQFVGGTGYHTILNPQLMPPVRLDLPPSRGLALTPALFGNCGPLAVVDFDVFKQQIFNKLLAAGGFNSSQFPIFLFYNTVMSGVSPTNLNKCCILGFHNAVTQQPSADVQTYAFIDFDASGLFGPTIHDTSIAAHEVGEWMDDPFGNNPTPLWGHVGQVGGCQGNLEVGDPLTGTNIPVVTGANGFKYHLQELAFFSWFYGAPSIAVNGWFSDNNTFKTDAGPVCTKK